jgi:hypothetical protein
MADCLKGITDVGSLEGRSKNYVVYPGFGTFPANDEKAFDVIIPDDAAGAAFDRAVLRVETRQSCGGLEIGVSLNGKALAPCAHEGTELFSPLAQNAGYPAREALKFYDVPLDLLAVGANRVEIKNLDGGKSPCQFRSIEIGLYR